MIHGDIAVEYLADYAESCKKMGISEQLVIIFVDEGHLVISCVPT